MHKSYAGIGSRKTTDKVEHVMVSIGKGLAKRGYTLRSGGAKGSDQAFERGCDKLNGYKEIYLPWSGFENSKSDLVVCKPRAFQIAEKYHPYYQNLKQGGQKLQARNSHQVLGLDLESSCNFVVCYTEGGKEKGGSGQALRIAKDYNIPIFNIGCYEDLDPKDIIDKFKEFLEEVEKDV